MFNIPYNARTSFSPLIVHVRHISNQLVDRYLQIFMFFFRQIMLPQALVNMVKMPVFKLGAKNKIAQKKKKNSIAQLQVITDIQNFTSICMCWRVACPMEFVRKCLLLINRLKNTRCHQFWPIKSSMIPNQRI